MHVLSDIHDSYNKRFLEKADVVFLSDEGISGNHEEFMISLWNTYHNRIIVLGQGKSGAMILDGQTQTVSHVAAVQPRAVVNTVGAGDSLFSSFVHFYLKDNSQTECFNPIECLKKAVTFAGWKIGESGGAKGFIAEQDLERLCGKIDYKVTKIVRF